MMSGDEFKKTGRELRSASSTSPGFKCRVNHVYWPCEGRSSDFSPIAVGAFPVMMQTMSMQPVACVPRDVSSGSYSSGYCPGVSPGSLLIPRPTIRAGNLNTFN